MPVPLLAEALQGDITKIPFAVPAINVAKQVAPYLATLYFVKRYTSGQLNTAERNLHGKVVILTGGSSGIGRSIAFALASRGAQLVLLTHEPLSDPFLADYIMDLRTSTGNELISAEHVDLNNLQSIRVFATKWVDNAPPRRLDMVILCAGISSLKGAEAVASDDGVENVYQVNYLANFHLLSILSPALRAQPPDRDVRVIFGTCGAYQHAPLLDDQALTLPRVGSADIAPPNIEQEPGSIFKANKSLKAKKMERKIIIEKPEIGHALTKLLLMIFAMAFQKHLSNYSRPDKTPNNVRVLIVDPGSTRTPGFRRQLTRGSVWGLIAFLLTYPLWWIFVKSSEMGAQTFLHAAMEEKYKQGDGGWFLKDCKEVKFKREEINDEGTQKKIWQTSEKAIEALEKESAKKRAEEKKRDEDAKKKAEKDASRGEKQQGSRQDKKSKRKT